MEGSVRNKFSMIFPVALGVLAVPVAILAHHGTTIYANSQPLIL
jgi:hypothetical protein